jgi:aldehyde dehydrogenase (NAD+)
MGHIVNERNYDRLHGILEKSHGKIVCGGSGDRATLAFEPTVVDNVSLEDPLLSQELFGPILPVLEADYEEATRVIASMPHPLAIYVFSTNQAEIDYGKCCSANKFT